MKVRVRTHTPVPDVGGILPLYTFQPNSSLKMYDFTSLWSNSVKYALGKIQFKQLALCVHYIMSIYYNIY